MEFCIENCIIKGENLKDAIEKNFRSIAQRAKCGNATGFELKKVFCECENGRIFLTISGKGALLADGRDGEPFTKVVQIDGAAEICPERIDFELVPCKKDTRTENEKMQSAIEKYCEAYPHLKEIISDFKSFRSNIGILAIPEHVTGPEIWALMSADSHALLVERGRKGGSARTPAKSNGGKVLAASMTPEERSARASKAAAARWTRVAAECIAETVAKLVNTEPDLDPKSDSKTKFMCNKQGRIYMRRLHSTLGFIELGDIPVDRTKDCLTELYTADISGGERIGISWIAARKIVEKYKGAVK